MRARDENVLAPKAQQFFRGVGEGKFLLIVLALALSEPPRLAAVWRENRGLRQKQLAHRRNHVLGRKFVSAPGGEHRVENERHVGVIGHDLGDDCDVLYATDQPDLERGYRHILEHKPRLVRHPIGIDRLQILDPGGVLDGDRGHYGKRVAAHRGEGQKIRLHPRAACRIRGGEGEHYGGEGRRGHGSEGPVLLAGGAPVGLR